MNCDSGLSSDFHATLYKLIISQLKYDQQHAAAQSIVLSSGLQSVKASNCLSLTLFDWWYKSVGMFQNITQTYKKDEKLPESPISPSSSLELADFPTTSSPPPTPKSSALSFPNPLSTTFLSKFTPTAPPGDDLSLLDKQVLNKGLLLSDVDINSEIIEWQTELLSLKNAIVMQEDPIMTDLINTSDELKVVEDENNTVASEKTVKEERVAENVGDESNVPVEETGEEPGKTDKAASKEVKEAKSENMLVDEAETCTDESEQARRASEQVQANYVVINNEEAKKEAKEEETKAEPGTTKLSTGEGVVILDGDSHSEPIDCLVCEDPHIPDSPTFLVQLNCLSRSEIQSVVSVLAQGWKSRKQAHKQVVKSIPRVCDWSMEDILLATFGDLDTIDVNVEKMKKHDFIRLKTWKAKKKLNIIK